MQKLKIPFIFTVITICISSCTFNKNESYTVLNKEIDFEKEKNKLFKHYKKDSLKLKAAHFLVNNASYHYHLTGHYLHQYDSLFDFIAALPKMKRPHENKAVRDKWTELTNKYGDFDIRKVETRTDTNVLTADYLIENIDLAFNQWEHQKEQTNADFHDFCHYILPYRVGNEEIVHWRTSYHNRFTGDSLFTKYIINNDYDSLLWALDNTFLILPRTFSVYQPSIKPYYMLKAPRGECKHLAEYMTFALRSLGIPASHDFIPAWGNRTGNHHWSFVFNNPKMRLSSNKNLPVTNDTSVVQTFAFQNRFKESNLKLPKGYYGQYRKTVPKVYRYGFSPSIDQLEILENLENITIYPPFNSPFLFDVTNEYLETSEVKLKINPKVAELKVAYLAVFDFPGMWKPAAISTIDKFGNISFDNVATNVLYLPVVYYKNQLVPVHNPVILQKDGKTKEIKSELNNIEQVKIIRKYPLFIRMIDFAKSLIDGYFEASNEASFTNAIKIHTINNIPLYWNETMPKLDKAYRYYRYCSRSDTGNMAEIEYYSDSSGQHVKIEGELIFEEGENKEDLIKAHDNDMNVYAFLSKNKKFWVGQDFGKPVNVTKIRYCPRNDTNCIIEGNDYELFYWDKRWKSLGRKIAKNDYLYYSNVPKGALLWLHCHSGGKEERPFMYENGMQIWW